MTQKTRILGIIDDPTFSHEADIVREIARWTVNGDWDWAELEDAQDEGAAFMDALRQRWPGATDEDIRRGINLAVAAAETVRSN